MGDSVRGKGGHCLGFKSWGYYLSHLEWWVAHVVRGLLGRGLGRVVCSKRLQGTWDSTSYQAVRGACGAGGEAEHTTYPPLASLTTVSAFLAPSSPC